MQNRKQEWIFKLEKIRDEKMMSIMDLCRDMGISYMTYRKLIDPEMDIDILAYTTMRKIDAYVRKTEERMKKEREDWDE